MPLPSVTLLTSPCLLYIYTSSPELYDGHLNIVDETGVTTLQGDIELATNNPETAFGNTDFIIVAVPSTMMAEMAETIYIHSDFRPIIGVVAGNGGSECAFRKCIARGNVFFGMERVPAVARLVQKGKTVRSVGYRQELHIASLPKSKVTECADLISNIFDKPCKVIPNFLNLTMTPSNPILHTARLKTLFANWHPGLVYERVPLFYEDWDNASSELLIACDNEVQNICRELPEFDLKYVKSLREYYESPTAEAMTKKISSIPAFKGLETPTVKVEGGLIPDLHSRYFAADFSYGLAIIKQIADFANVKTPNIDIIMAWYKSIAIEKKDFNFKDYGIFNRMDFEKFYQI